MRFLKKIKNLTPIALIIAGLYFFFGGKLLYTGIIIVVYIIIDFIENNQGDLLFAAKLKIKNTKTSLVSLLFKGSPISLLIVWYIIFGIINNRVVEPLTTLSARIPYGAVSEVPEVYKGIWEINDNYTSFGITSKLFIRNRKMTFEWMDMGDNDTKQRIKCKSPKVFYNFSLLKDKHGHKIWYEIFDIIVLPLVPETIFGSQYIYWSCDNSKDKELSYLSLSEPSTDHLLSEVGIVLHEPHYTDSGEYESIEYISTLYVKKIKKIE